MTSKIKSFVKNNRKELLQMAFMIGSVALPQICSAGAVTSIDSISSSMPWKSGLSSLATEITGPIPKLFGILSVAAAGGMMAFGEMGPAAKKVMQIVFGIGMAIGAVNLTNLVTSGTTGLTF